MDSEEKALREGMRPKQISFCEEYAIDKNGTQAAIRAGHSEKTARQIASENLTKPDIAKYIEFLLAKQTKRTEINADYILKGLKTVADRCSKDDTFEHAGANRAFELMGKHLGMFTDKVELSGHVDFSGMTDEQLMDELKDE